ncbi:hypothetical protein C0Q70_18101 [Pomacea canaliculata]|uniref:KY-like immunoglobulin-like domain-containing protein n=1 Tax=Pomacea canaliculata TaxID=400727 RepID=A0A2T7NMB1_POMCA|nr:hypothetical protein C0Q70_18101 [Pomacea canaliculata]
MNITNSLWEPLPSYPPLRPPEVRKEEIFKEEDYATVDLRARMAPATLNTSFEKLLNYLVHDLTTDLQKVRSIFCWMGAQRVGTRQVMNNDLSPGSPEYLTKKAYMSGRMVGELFATLCRKAGVPCILVRGKGKGSSYEVGDQHISGRNTWAVVFLEGSWRFVFPHWAFIGLNAFSTGHWTLVEDSGKPARDRPSASDGVLEAYVDEFWFLTNPDVMNCICHPDHAEYQLLTSPWTEKQFFSLPFYQKEYFSSGWKLLSPDSCVVEAKDGKCCISFQSPTGGDSRLDYRLYFDEKPPERKFPDEIQTEHYVNRLKQGERLMSLLVKLPLPGAYQLEVIGIHDNQRCHLVNFRLTCQSVPLDTRPFPSNPDIGYGYDDTARSAGLSDPSHTDGLVVVSSGQAIDFSFKAQPTLDVRPKLVHRDRSREDLRDHVSLSRTEDKATVTARLPDDDASPEYALEIDNGVSTSWRSAGEDVDGPINRPEEKESVNVLNYLLTCDQDLNVVTKDERKQLLRDVNDALEKGDSMQLERAVFRYKTAGISDLVTEEKILEKQHKYERIRAEVVEAAKSKDIDRQDNAIRTCVAYNLEDRGDIGMAKEMLKTLCGTVVYKAIESCQRGELQNVLKRVSCTCVGEAVQTAACYKDGLQMYEELRPLDESREEISTLTQEDKISLCKPPKPILDVISATLILLGETEDDLKSWRTVWGKLNGGEDQEPLFTRMAKYDDTRLTQQQVQRAVAILDRWSGAFDDNLVARKLYLWCTRTVEVYRLRRDLGCRRMNENL